MRKFFFSLVLFCLLPSLVFASYITLNTTLQTNVLANKLSVAVKVINQGDESAYNVQAEVRVGGKAYWADQQGELTVNGTYQADLAIPLQLKQPGSYPLVLIMHYADANQYPFSALSCQTFNCLSADSQAQVLARAESLSFWQQGHLKVRLKNLSDSQLKFNLSLIAPQEISLATKSKIIILKPGTETKTSFELKNFSALSGSSYQIFLQVDYLEQGRQFVSLVPAIVKVQEEKQILGLNYFWLFFILLLLIVGFIAAQVITKK